jgi:hypothetical protein
MTSFELRSRSATFMGYFRTIRMHLQLAVHSSAKSSHVRTISPIYLEDTGTVDLVLSLQNDSSLAQGYYYSVLFDPFFLCFAGA